MRGLFTQTIALRLRSADATRMVLGDGTAALAPGAPALPRPHPDPQGSSRGRHPRRRGGSPAVLLQPVPQLRGRTAFEGEITTITVFEDNIIVKSAITENGVGRVLVMDGAGSLCCALMGDWMADRAASNGWAGVVINGAVRDVEALSRIDLGVKRLGSNPRRSGKDDSGGGMSEVTFGA